MGAGKMTSAVADAGPLIHLSEIGSLQFLRIFDNILIPNAVWDETVGRGRIPSSTITSLDFVSRTPSSPADIGNFIITNSLSHLQSGEIEALFLCNSRAIPVLLTDDLAARDGAKRLNVTPVGSLGIVIRAYHRRIISLNDAKARLMLLQKQSSLFVTSTICHIDHH